MTIGRFGVDRPIRGYGFEFLIGSCGCILVNTWIAHFTWYAKECKCAKCDKRNCECLTED